MLIITVQMSGALYRFVPGAITSYGEIEVVRGTIGFIEFDSFPESSSSSIAFSVSMTRNGPRFFDQPLSP
jgi:hypothetical protein